MRFYCYLTDFFTIDLMIFWIFSGVVLGGLIWWIFGKENESGEEGEYGKPKRLRKKDLKIVSFCNFMSDQKRKHLGKFDTFQTWKEDLLKLDLFDELHDSQYFNYPNYNYFEHMKRGEERLEQELDEIVNNIHGLFCRYLQDMGSDDLHRSVFGHRKLQNGRGLGGLFTMWGSDLLIVHDNSGDDNDGYGIGGKILGFAIYSFSQWKYLALVCPFGVDPDLSEKEQKMVFELLMSHVNSAILDPDNSGAYKDYIVRCDAGSDKMTKMFTGLNFLQFRNNEKHRTQDGFEREYLDNDLEKYGEDIFKLRNDLNNRVMFFGPK